MDRLREWLDEFSEHEGDAMVLMVCGLAVVAYLTGWFG